MIKFCISLFDRMQVISNHIPAILWPQQITYNWDSSQCRGAAKIFSFFSFYSNGNSGITWHNEALRYIFENLLNSFPEVHWTGRLGDFSFGSVKVHLHSSRRHTVSNIFRIWCPWLMLWTECSWQFSSSGFTFMVCIIGHVQNQNDSCVITQGCHTSFTLIFVSLNSTWILLQRFILRNPAIFQWNFYLNLEEIQ